MSIKVSYSTMGQSSPATVADDAGRAGGYRYKGDPKRTPDCAEYVPLAEREPEPRIPAAEASSHGKAERVAAFAAILAEIAQRTPRVSKDAALIEAAKRVEVGIETAQQYVRELRKQGESNG